MPTWIKRCSESGRARYSKDPRAQHEPPLTGASKTSRRTGIGVPPRALESSKDGPPIALFANVANGAYG